MSIPSLNMKVTKALSAFNMYKRKRGDKKEGPPKKEKKSKKLRVIVANQNGSNGSQKSPSNSTTNIRLDEGSAEKKREFGIIHESPESTNVTNFGLHSDYESGGSGDDEDQKPEPYDQVKGKLKRNRLALRSKRIRKGDLKMSAVLKKKIKTSIQAENFKALARSDASRFHAKQEHHPDYMSLAGTEIRKDVTPPYLLDSRLQAQKCFDWLISPFKSDKFFKDIWEQKPLLLKRSYNREFFSSVFSTEEFDKILREKEVTYAKNLTITRYEDGVRKNVQCDGRAYPAVVWDHYQNGCSIRLLNPQTFSRSVWKLNSILQEHFGSFVGANVYLTPPGSQGFAPHYDDIEAFILQLEGKKSWAVYAPLDGDSTLPRYSSKDFDRKEIQHTAPMLQVDLEPGDLLYLPRGFIHEAKTFEDCHSLHITLSAAQKNTFGDLMEHLIPQAIKRAFENDLEFRQSLPIDYMDYMGIANQDMRGKKREEFLMKVQDLTCKLVNYIHVDSAADQMAKKYISDALPPIMNSIQKSASIHGSGERWLDGQVVGGVELEPDSLIKLIRFNALRIVMEDDCVRLYHSLENSREYHEYEPQYIEIGSELAPAVEQLIHSYPEFVEIESLELPNLEDRMDIANLLYDKGLVIVRSDDLDCVECP